MKYSRRASLSGFVKIIVAGKKEWKEQIKNSRPDLSDEQINDIIQEISGYADNKKKLMAVHWIMKKAIILPEDEYKLDECLQAMKSLQSSGQQIDFQKFALPSALLDEVKKIKKKKDKDESSDQEEDTDQEEETTEIFLSPDNPKFKGIFTDRTPLENGVVIYKVKDDKDGQYAVREIIDSHWGEAANPWCLASRAGKGLDANFQYWKHYSNYDKRIAFKNGKLLAFCAGSSMNIRWWDKQDRPWPNLPPGSGASDPVIAEEIAKMKEKTDAFFSSTGENSFEKMIEADLSGEIMLIRLFQWLDHFSSDRAKIRDFISKYSQKRIFKNNFGNFCLNYPETSQILKKITLPLMDVMMTNPDIIYPWIYDRKYANSDVGNAMYLLYISQVPENKLQKQALRDPALSIDIRERFQEWQTNHSNNLENWLEVWNNIKKDYSAEQTLFDELPPHLMSNDLKVRILNSLFGEGKEFSYPNNKEEFQMRIEWIASLLSVGTVKMIEQSTRKHLFTYFSDVPSYLLQDGSDRKFKDSFSALPSEEIKSLKAFAEEKKKELVIHWDSPKEVSKFLHPKDEKISVLSKEMKESLGNVRHVLQVMLDEGASEEEMMKIADKFFESLVPLGGKATSETQKIFKSFFLGRPSYDNISKLMVSSFTNHLKDHFLEFCRLFAENPYILNILLKNMPPTKENLQSLLKIRRAIWTIVTTQYLSNRWKQLSKRAGVDIPIYFRGIRIL